LRGIKGKHPDKVDVGGQRFDGLDSYQRVMQSDADLVILATPPGFRPLQFEAAVTAGKHVFMEKPLATDALGVRRVLAAAKIARDSGLAVAVGLQRRHQTRYRECLMRLRDGAIGDPIFARAYWNGTAREMRPRTRNQTELEYQLRNWGHFTWLSGDQITEQHIHNLDVINWLMGDHPLEAQGQGGRACQDELAGPTFDHHMVEFTYGSGTRLLSQCRRQRGCWNGVGEHVHGTRGSADIANAKIFDASGSVIWQSDAVEPQGRGWQQQQDDLIAALRRGDIPCEAEYGATSTMTAILGRMATYTGKIVKWDQAIADSACLADVDRLHSLDHGAPVQPDEHGRYRIPAPSPKIRQA
jgi:predicted dehydrogenase